MWKKRIIMKKNKKEKVLRIKCIDEILIDIEEEKGGRKKKGNKVKRSWF